VAGVRRSTIARHAGQSVRRAGARFSPRFKDILQLCDRHGVEHRTPMNQTALMAAAGAQQASAPVQSPLAQ